MFKHLLNKVREKKSHRENYQNYLWVIEQVVEYTVDKMEKRLAKFLFARRFLTSILTAGIRQL